MSAKAVSVGVIGAAGKMGRSVCAAVAAAPDLDLVAAVDTHHAGETVQGLVVTGSLDALDQVDVAVDFTVAGAAVENARWCAANGAHVVVGTTGVDEAALEELGSLYPAGGSLGCVVAPNFAIGAVLMMRFAELAAPWFETAEIIELHHDAKADAPSGTAMLTAERMARGRTSEWGADPTRVEVLAGARGGTGPAGIHVHSIRLRGLVAHQEVVLGTTGQTLTIRHDSLDRESFMPGVVLAVRQVGSRPGVTVGLENLLGL